MHSGFDGSGKPGYYTRAFPVFPYGSSFCALHVSSGFRSFYILNMPANKKYLTRSPWQRWLKITAGFFGGYGVVISFFSMLAYFFERKNILITGIAVGYILWAVLLLFAFLCRSAWKIWVIYLLLILLFSSPYLFAI